MSTGTPPPERDKGFAQVDDQPDPGFLVAAMEDTAEFGSVVQLRTWEREQLAVHPGDEVLDVGCGIADVARSLAREVAPGGRVLGVDVSEAMLAVARQRAEADGVEATFRVGDALALGEPDASFDVCRSERVLQWLPDLSAAITEFVRVLRPGGRLSVIDTDWRTLGIDIPDLEATVELARALVLERGDPRAAGGKLLNLCRDAGLVDIRVQGAVQVWDRWDPDTEPGPAGFFPLDSVIGSLADDGLLDRAVTDRMVEQVYAAARADRFCMSLTMMGVVGRVPA